MPKIDQGLTIVPPPLWVHGNGYRKEDDRDPPVLASPLEIRFCGHLTAERGLGSCGAFPRSKTVCGATLEGHRRRETPSSAKNACVAMQPRQISTSSSERLLVLN